MRSARRRLHFSAPAASEISSSQSEGFVYLAETFLPLIGHADSYPVLAHYLAVVERGANIEFDFLGMPWSKERHGEDRTVELTCELLARGYADRIFLSQDVCHDSQLKRYDGNGYVYLTETFMPRLRAAGVSDLEIETMTVANPRRLLTIG